MNILVTGGTGYIGSYFIPSLLKKGHRIRLLVRNEQKAKSLFGDSCEYRIGDVTEKDSLIGCCDGIDLVYHMVAKTGNDLPSDENFLAFRKVNVEGTRNMITESKRAGVKKFIFVSSIAAMGIVEKTPISESSICSPYLPYQVSKYEAEQLIINEYNSCGFPGIILRPTKVCGVGEHEYSYLTLAKLCKRGIFFKVGNGHNYTSNVFISDLIQSLNCCLDRGKAGQIYIISAPDSIDFVESGKLIAETLGVKIKVVKVPSKIMISLADIQERVMRRIKKKPIVTRRNIEATVKDRIYDLEKARSELGYNPQVTMKKGIKEIIEWYREIGIV